MKRIQIFLLLFCLALIYSCKTEKLQLPFEPVKSLKGNWRITGVARNGNDLTNFFDFSKFRINFTDSSYTLSEKVPFLVTESGTWHFDDPQYPFQLALKAKDSTEKISPLVFPIVGGKRTMVLTLSPGCKSNIYQYNLEKAD